MRRAYENTTVSVSKSIGDISALVVARGGQIRQTECSDGFQIEIAFPAKGKANAYNRFRITRNIHKDHVAAFRDAHPKTRRSDQEVMEDERRRLARTMFHFVKACMVAVDEGIVDVEEAFLPFLELKDGGATLYESAGEGIRNGQLAAVRGLLSLPGRS